MQQQFSKITVISIFLLGFTLLVISLLLVPSSPKKMMISVVFILFCILGFLLIYSTLRIVHHPNLSVPKLQEQTRDLIAANRALEQLLQQIKDEKEKTAALVNNFSDGLLLIQNDRVILVNPKAREIFNLSPEDLLRQDLLELTKNIKIYPLVRLLLVKGPQLNQEELILENKQPRQILEVSTTTIIEKNQEKGQIIILHDITRQKVVERMKRDFVMVAAHQLREPLTALKWNIDLLRKKDLGPLTPTQEAFLLKANQSNETMMKLVNDLLNSIELEYGKSPYTFQNEDILALTEKAVAEIRPFAENKGLKLILEVPRQAVPQVRMDGEKFKVALQNIIDNAIRYSRQGSIRVTCLFLEKTKRFQFRIEDEGIGIPVEEHTKVFTRFFRSAEAIRLEAKGSGLGLHMTQNIIEAHGGEIWFDSQPGKGTTFNFSIPLVRPV